MTDTYTDEGLIVITGVQRSKSQNTSSSGVNPLNLPGCIKGGKGGSFLLPESRLIVTGERLKYVGEAMKSWKDNFTLEQLEIRRIRAREWRRNNKEKARATLEAYKAAHPGRINATARKAQRKRAANDPGYSARGVARFYAGRPWLKHYHYAVSRCDPNTKNAGYRKYYVNAGITVKISPDEVKALWFRDNAAGMVRPSLDRIYCAGNYSIGNCRFIEQRDNASKRQNPDAELVAIERRKQRYADRK